MSILAEVKQKRDYAQSRKDDGESGYDPAIDFYNRIIAEMEILEMNLQNAVRLLKQHDPNLLTNPYPELREFDPHSDTSRYSKWLESENRYETKDEFFARLTGVHKNHNSFDPSTR